MSKRPKSGLKNAPIDASTIAVTNPKGVESTYSNNIGISATLLDFTLFFVETGQLPGANGTVARNELKAAVTLPMASGPQIVQALTQMLRTAQDQMKAHMTAQMVEAAKAAGAKRAVQASVKQ